MKSQSKRIFVASRDFIGRSDLFNYLYMMPAPVQNPTSLGSLSRVKRGTCSKFGSLFGLLMFFILSPDLVAAQSNPFTANLKNNTAFQSSDTGLSVRKTMVPNNGPSAEQKRKRQWLIGGLNVVGYGTSIVVFNNQWYQNYDKTSFHTFNDAREWLQMDKLGHAWAAYNSGRGSAAMWRWAGLNNKKATWIGGLSSTVYLTVIEILDAHSAKWGWSWADMGANVFGSGLFIGQQLGWHEQRIQFKFSFHRKTHAEPVLHERADELFGQSWTERMLKDYNGQTYWLSANLKSFFPKSNLPPWFNIAVGYGGEGMFGGFENKWTNADPVSSIDRTDIKRYRQWYLSPDINFSKIKTTSKTVRVLFAVLDAFKFPAPSLELSDGRLTINAIHF